ncbi:unnamed protein product [Macrosiphum euphorbiae]|uniref:MADF domain-containing protein n=1 Tax=Macrosiphum euphorbiae TaxID=13131 RepID=A0AAV0YB08_9HEMI|nr:unnamed protein product [Macrosiphum euphorbiae]
MSDVRCWSKEFLTDFLNIYKSFSCLWKSKSKDYSNKHLRNDAYDEMVNFCKPSFPEANREFVVKKIQSLRGSFRKEMKKVMESQRSGSSKDDIYVPTLWYYDLLLFTKDQEIPTDSISNLGENECPVMNEPMLDDDESNDITDNTEPINSIVPEDQPQNTVIFYSYLNFII